MEDEESGLHYNLNRYYDPDSGQYLSPDPIGLEGGLRTHGYVHDPMQRVDPLGLAGCPKASLSPKIKRLSEANITDNGITVLGSFQAPPGQMSYIQKATTGKYKGSSYFDLGNAWTPIEGKVANRHFLEIVGGKGDKMIFSTPKNKIPSGTSLDIEVKYLKDNFNYKWVNSWSMQKGSI